MSTGQVRMLALIAAILLIPALGRAQDSNSATVAGVVRDASGAVLPGVTVEVTSPALIEKVRVATTDGDGRFRIVELRPGEYSVTFTLTGFRTLRREGIQLSTGFTATVNGELVIGGVEETITVTGAAPVVDVTGVQEQQVFSGETVRDLPIGNNQGVYVTLLPAATQGGLANHDVGGTKGENSQNFSVHGGRPAELQMYRDGLYFGEHLSNAASWGSSLNSATVQEIAVQATGGLTAEASGGGVSINAIGREGGNEFHGTLSTDFGSPDLQSNNINDDLRARGATLTGTVRRLFDVGVGVGGPLKRDKVWFFASGRKWVSSNNQAGNYFNKSTNPLFYEQDLSRPAYDRNMAQEIAVRLTWQITQKQKISGTGRYEYNCNCYNGITAGNLSPEAVASNWYVPRISEQATWTYPATNRVLFQVGGLYLGGNHRRKPGAEAAAPNIAITDRLTAYTYGSPDRVLTPFSDLALQEYGQGNINASMLYVTGSHNFKVGALVLQSRRDLFQPFERAIAYTFAGRVPEQVTLYAAPLNMRMRTRQYGLFAQEQWTLNRMTLYAGLRFDYDRGWNPDQDVPAGPYIGARHYDKVDDVPNWKDINPRVGAAFDLFGNGRTAIKGNLGRFVAFEGNGGINFFNNPANAITTSATRVWTDNGDYIPQESELGPLSNANFGRPILTTQYADDVIHGWGKRGYNWQTALSFQHEVVSGVGVSVGYYRTWYGNFNVTDNTLVGASDYDSYCINAPNDSKLPNPNEQICGLFEIKPAKFGQVNNVVNLDSTYGGQSEVYDGIDITLNARLGEGRVIGGGFATGRTVTDNCDIVDDVPEAVLATNNAPSRFCHLAQPWIQLTQVKLFGVYPLPYGVRASVNYQHLPGPATTAQYVITGPQIAAALGRQPAAGARATATVELIENGQLRRENRLNQLNFAVTRVFSVGGYRFQPGIELHNALNASTVHTITTRYGPAWESVRGVLTPRLIKFGLQVDF